MLDRWMNDDEWRFKIGGSVLVALVLIVGLYYIITYRYITTGTIIATNWELKIARLQYMTLQEDDWYVPNGGRVDHTNREIHHYEDYVSGYHYENRSGSTYPCGTKKNPKTCKNPDTRIKVDEYSSRPVWRTKYYYYIDRWKDISPLVTSGNDKELVEWPNTTDYNYNDTNIIGNIKLGGRWSHFWLVIRVEDTTYERDMIDSEWYRYAKGEKIKLTLGYFNNIISVEKIGF